MDSIQEQACDWIAKLDAGSMSDADTEALARWINIDSSHGKALMEMADLLDNMSVLSQLSEVIPLDTPALSQQRKKAGPGRPFRLNPVSAISIIVVLAFIGIFSGIIPKEPETEQIASARTSIGELKTITLPDGSEVTLNTHSQIDLEFSQQRRKVILIRGEANFVVEPDKKRPFIVVAGDKIVEAVGTAFNVKAQGKQIEVTVTEGLVTITSAIKPGNNDQTSPSIDINSKSDQPVINVAAGHTAVITGNIESVKPLDPVSIEKKLAWQKGIIVFEGETLEQVVEEISRYTTSTFVISDEEARYIRVGGYFAIGDIDKMLDILEHGFSISATTDSTGTIYLSRLTTARMSEKSIPGLAD